MEIGTKCGLKATGGMKQYEIVAAGTPGAIDAEVAGVFDLGGVQHAQVRGTFVDMVPQHIAIEDFERDEVPPRPDGTPRLGRVKKGQVVKYRYEPKLDATGTQIVIAVERQLTLTKPVESLAAILGAGKKHKQPAAVKESTGGAAPA